MAGQVFLPHGTTFQFNSQTVAEVQDISMPEESKGDVEITSHDSGGVRRYLSGLKEGGTVTVTCRRVPGDAGQQACRDNYDAVAADAEECIITLPPGATDDSQSVTFTFDGYVNNLGGSLPADADDPADLPIQIKVDGAVAEAMA